MFKKIFKHLQNNGFMVFSIGQHEDICDKPYVVVKECGEKPYLTGLVEKTVEFIVFYPLGNYTEAAEYLEFVKDKLGELEEVKFAQVMTPMEIDTQIRAYSARLNYKIVLRRR